MLTARHVIFSTGDYSPGDVLGEKYTIIEIIGRGSNGVTYKVTSLTWSLDVSECRPVRHLHDFNRLRTPAYL